MTITPAVASQAKHFGLDPELLQAIVQAEGDIIKAVKCTYPNLEQLAFKEQNTTLDKALEITCRTVIHAMSDWIKGGGETRQDQFIAFLASRWAPIGAKNDPTNLNANWANNVDRIWTPILKTAGHPDGWKEDV